MASFSGTFTAAADVSNAIMLLPTQSMNYTITEQSSGTWVVIFQQSSEGAPLSSWPTVTSHTADAATTTFYNDTNGIIYLRLYCDSTDVSIDYTLDDDTGEVISTKKDPLTGVDLWDVTDQGVTFKQNLTVNGTQTVTGAQTFTGLATYGANITLTPPATDAIIGAVGTAPVSGTNAVTIERVGSFFRLNFTLTACQIPVTDGAGSGSHGPYKLFDFTAGGVVILACRQDYTAFAADGTGVTDVAVTEIGVGSTIIAAAADGVLGATEDDIGGDINITLSGGDGSGTSHTGATVAMDGTSTAADLNLNWSGTAATVDGNGTIDVTGTITVVGMLLGDD